MTTTVGPRSPTHSPRLPSPPPFPEVQIGPQSPTGNPAGVSLAEPEDPSDYEQAAARRIRPGTKVADMHFGPPLVPLSKVSSILVYPRNYSQDAFTDCSQINSSFQLQEHCKALYHHNTKAENNITKPITRDTALVIAKSPPGVDDSLWLYELCRLLIQLTNSVIVAFYADDPPCSAETCKEMRASEWQYLCAVHNPPKACCAIDYSTHTLDWAGNQLTSKDNFPSRLTLGTAATGGSQGGLRVLTNIMRRCYRIFAHAWYQHRQVFWNVENSSGLYIYFKTVCEVYNLMPPESYTVPPEAEGLPSDDPEPSPPPSETPSEGTVINESITAAAPKVENPASTTTAANDEHDTSTTTISTGATTRRHKHTPSTGSAVTTITEDNEEHASMDDKDVPLTLPAVAKSNDKDHGSEAVAAGSADIEGLASGARNLHVGDEGGDDETARAVQDDDMHIEEAAS